jgi:glycosyltransferase involved in cell wall biosynthesis
MTNPGPEGGDLVQEAAAGRVSLRILLVASAYPDLTTGRLRQVHFVRGLGVRHRVVVVSLASPLVAADPPPIEGAAGVIAVAATRGRHRRTRARLWLARMRNQPSDAIVALAAAASRVAAAEPFDVLLVAGREIGPVHERLPRLPIVLDLCDSRAARLRAQLGVAPLAARPALAVRCLTERRYERSLLARSDHVLVASDRDRSALDGHAPSLVSIVPNGVDTDTWRRRTPQLGNAVVFSGAMDYPANADAAVHLASRVMPLVWRHRPATRLVIAGRDPVPDVAALAADPRVTVTGTVDDIRPFLEEAGVYAAPLRFASGIQNKLLEAMAMAIPVVTTPIAVAGLAAPGGDAPPVRVAVGPEAFAAGILEALAERDANPAPDQVGREYVEARFGWPMAVARLEETLIQAVKGRAT